MSVESEGPPSAAMLAANCCISNSSSNGSSNSSGNSSSNSSSDNTRQSLEVSRASHVSAAGVLRRCGGSSSSSSRSSSSRSSSSRRSSNHESRGLVRGRPAAASCSWQEGWSLLSLLGLSTKGGSKGRGAPSGWGPLGPWLGGAPSHYSCWRQRFLAWLQLRLYQMKARASVLLQLPLLLLLQACPIVGRLFEWVFHLSSLGAPALLYPFGCLLTGILSPFASLTALCLWLIELLDVALVAPQAAAAELAALAAAPPAIAVLNHFSFSPIWSESLTCSSSSSSSSSLGVVGGPWRAIDLWGLCLPLVVGATGFGGGPPDPRGGPPPLLPPGASSTLQLSIYCRVLVDVPLLTLGLHLSRWLHAQCEIFGAPVHAEEDPNPRRATAAAAAAATGTAAGAAPPGASLLPRASLLVRRGPRGPTGLRSAASALRLRLLRLLRLLERCLSSSPAWASLSGVKRLYLAAITYMMVRWMYTDRLDLLVGAPAAAVVGPLSKGLAAETQALFMAAALLCASTLCFSYCVLSFLKAADLLPARLLHHTKVLCCTHLLLHGAPQSKPGAPRGGAGPQEPQNRQGEAGGSPQPLQAQDGTQTPSSTDSAEQDACIFCFEELKPGELLRVVTACGHKFHAACIDVWLFERLKASCPMCGRLRYPNGEGPAWIFS
ncbi:hypothetical protein Efla_000958 [Eimeria flavescens]